MVEDPPSVNLSGPHGNWYSIVPLIRPYDHVFVLSTIPKIAILLIMNEFSYYVV